MENITIVIVSALVGAVVSYLGAALKGLVEIRREIDGFLWKKREEIYGRPWADTGVLPIRPQVITVSYGHLTELATSLSDWYYQEGGLFLSGGSRRAFSHMMDMLEDIRSNGEPGQALTAEDYEHSRKACSEFRSWLARDLLSRRAGPYPLQKPRFKALEHD